MLAAAESSSISRPELSRDNGMRLGKSRGGSVFAMGDDDGGLYGGDGERCVFACGLRFDAIRTLVRRCDSGDVVRDADAILLYAHERCGSSARDCCCEINGLCMT